VVGGTEPGHQVHHPVRTTRSRAGGEADRERSRPGTLARAGVLRGFFLLRVPLVLRNAYRQRTGGSEGARGTLKHFRENLQAVLAGGLFIGLQQSVWGLRPAADALTLLRGKTRAAMNEQIFPVGHVAVHQLIADAFELLITLFRRVNSPLG